MPDTYWWSTHTKPSLALFARTLLEQRDFSTKVRKLTIFVPGRTRAYMMNLDALDEGVHGVCRAIDSGDAGINTDV